MTAASPTVLIAEQHDGMRSYLADNLQADGYWPICAADSDSALEMLSGGPDVLLVDVNGETLSVVDAIRDARCPGVDPQLPIMVLTSDPSGVHRTRLYERGADDVLLKPFSYPELRARLGGLLRRAQARRAPRLLRAGSLRLDVGSRRVWVGDVEIPALRGKEYELLLALITEPERVFTRQELLRSVWGFRSAARTRTLDSHAARLRARLQVNGGRYVHCVWGVGYRLIDAQRTGS
jgi:DNA-binding response OmpR family regulator